MSIMSDPVIGYFVLLCSMTAAIMSFRAWLAVGRLDMRLQKEKHEHE